MNIRFLGLLLIAACTREKAPVPTARVDTLPGGIVRTISDAPLGWSDSTSAWKLVLLHEIQPPEGDSGALFDPQALAMNDRGEVAP